MLYPLPITIEPHVIRKPNLEVYVPVVVDPKHPQAAERMNHTIQKQVMELIRTSGYEEDPKNIQVQGWYEIKLNERGYLSLTLSVYDYPYHAAHGMTYQRGLTFETETGKLLSLPELFKSGAPYVDVLSKHVAAQIKERDIQTLEPFKSIRPDQDFYMTDKALVLFFQLYEIAAYVYGFLHFPISIYDLKDIKAENGIIDKLWY